MSKRIKVSASTSSTSAEQDLSALYPRAARAFLRRDLTKAFELVNQAFNLLPIANTIDVASITKWEVLRITLEATSDAEFDVETIYSRARILFGYSEFPAGVLTTLLLAAMKRGMTASARAVADDWFSRSDPNVEGYERAVEVYALHLLPRLEAWGKAEEFLNERNGIAQSSREVSFGSNI